MKKTFTLFSVSALFLMLLFPVSVKAEPIVLSFIFENPNGGQDEDCNGNTINNYNAITTSDFHFSSALYDEVKKQSSYLDKSWTSFKAGAKACTRHDVHLEAGSYTFTLKTTWMYGNNKTRVPIIRVNSQDYSLNNVNYPSNEEVDLEYTVSIPSTNDYPILITCVDGEADKFCMRTLTITPNCTQRTLTVSADNAEHGDVTGEGSYCDDSEVTVTATPKSGYLFVNWTNSSTSTVVSSNASYTFNITSNLGLTANFVACSGETVTVVANNAEYGTVTGEGSYCAGSQVNLTATPNSGCRFVEWEVTSGSATLDDVHSASTHFTMSNPAAAVTVQANFELDPCTTTRVIQCETCDNSYTPGSSIPSQLNPNNTWDGHGDFYGTGYASFEQSTGEIYFPVYLPAATYTFTVICANGGDKKLNVYNSSGTKVVDGASLSNDWNDSWKTATTSSYALSAGKYYIGLYAPDNYAAFDQLTITANSNVFCPNTITMQKNGDASAAAPTSSPANTAMAGTKVTITAGEASANHYFINWTATPAVTFENATDLSTTFVMPAEDVTITANYGEVVSSEFTYTTSGSGSITCATASGSSVASGTVIEMTAVPSTDYVFTGWTATAGTFSDESALTTNFTMPAEAATVTANFAQIDNVIITGNAVTTNHIAGDGTLEITSVPDFDAFNHNVLKFAYSNMDGKYRGFSISTDAGYTPSALVTGFGFYYKTEKSDDHVAFCFDPRKGQEQQIKWQLEATNNVWKYYYISTPHAINWNDNSGIDPLIIFMNGDDTDAGTHTTYKNSGAFYMSEIAATTITSKPDIANYHYTNNRGGAMQVNDYGTLCLPMGGTISGATLYSLAGKETKDEKLYIVLEDEGNTVVAGKPYITQSTATSYTVTMSGPYSNDVQAGNGLVGTYTDMHPDEYQEEGPHNYILYENAFKKAGTGVTVGAYRAYLNLDAVGAVTPAPSARRIRMVIEGTNSATGLEDLINDQLPVTSKVLIDGQLFIIREGKTYNAQGQMIK